MPEVVTNHWDEDRSRWLMSLTALAVRLSSCVPARAERQIKDPQTPRSNSSAPTER